MIESKYKNQIKDIQDVHEKQISESQSKIKRLESELKVFGERSAMENRGKLNEHGQLEKKLGYKIENEKRMSSEIDELKNERDRRIQDYQR